MGFFKHTPSDYPSLLLWLLDETHFTVTAATAVTILWTQNAHVVWFTAGAFGATLVARAVKHMIQQPRPPAPSDMSRPSPVRPKRTYGMPSTHSTALTFYAVYIFEHLPLLSSSPAGLLAERIALVGYAGLGLWSRVELGYHTVAQVGVGALVGAVCAIAWGAAWTAYPSIQVDLQHVIDLARAVIF